MFSISKDLQTSARMLSPEQQQILELGLQKLAEDQDGPARPTTSNMQWEQGDGTGCGMIQLVSGLTLSIKSLLS